MCVQEQKALMSFLRLFGFLGLLVFHALVLSKLKQGKQKKSEVVSQPWQNSFMLFAVAYSVHKQLTTYKKPGH